MNKIFRLTPKRQKKLHKLFSVVAIFSLFLQLGSGIFYARPVIAEEPPVVEEPAETPQEPTSTEIPAEVITTPEINSTPEVLTSPEPTPIIETPAEATPTSVEEVTPTPEPTENNVPQENTTPPQETGPPLDLEKPIEEPVSGQIAPTPTPTPAPVCLAEGQEIKETTNEDWNISLEEGWSQTKESVKLGVKYVYPQENKVTVTFKCLPKDGTTSLKIEKVKISDLKLPEGTNPYGEYAYDITTGMQDGTFEYDVTLPKPEGQTAEVSFMEDKNGELKTVDEEKLNQEGDKVEVENLDHFTIFVVVNPDDTINESSVGNEDNGWVSDNSYATFDSSSDYAEYGFPDLGVPTGAVIQGIEVLVEGYTTGRDLDISIWNQSAGSDTYTSPKTANLGSSETTVTVGTPTDKWGKTWNSSDFNTSFKVFVDATSGGNTAYLDQIQVKVYYDLLPDLTAVKSHTPGGNATINQVFTWNIRIQNNGNANAVFNSGNSIFQDLLPNSNVSYGALTVTKSDASVTGTISCLISGSTIVDCTASGGSVVIPPAKYIDISFPATFSASGTKTNPRTTGGCKVDPSSTNGVVSESNEGNNTCSESVIVDPLRPDLVVTKTNDVSGSTTVNQPFKWILHIVNNGAAVADFDEGETILIDNLPSNDSIISYGSPTVDNLVGVNHNGGIVCSISSSENLTCSVSSGSGTRYVDIDPGGSFDVSFIVTVSSAGIYTNPRSGGSNKCRVDPNGNITESNDNNNDCLDTVTISTIQSAPNPTLSQSCGLDMVLVIDTSTSIDNTELALMKNAFKNFVNAFIGTPTQIAIVSFDDMAVLQSGFTNDLNSLSESGGVIDGINGDGYTNWEDTLQMSHGLFPNRVDKPDLIVFTSDGNPTDSSAGGPDLGQPNAHLAPAILQANLAKADDIRIITLGIGDDLSPANLQAISSADAYYNSANFETLITTLQDLATDLCGGTITVNKYIDSVSPTTRGGAGWQFYVTGPNDYANYLGTDDNGQDTADDLTAGTGYSIVETGLLPGYSFVSAVCRNQTGASEGSTITDGVGSIDVSDNDIISCDFVNTLDKGTITITKDVIPDDASIWDFIVTGQGGPYNVNDLGDGQSYTINNLLPGSYDITEITDSNYSTTVTCGAVGPLSQNGFLGTVQANQDLHCTFINTRNPYCGDGVVNQGSEVCDDGNITDGDGCSSTCQIEAYCGDGIKNGDEQCDGTDGVTSGENFCTQNCTLVPIYDGSHSCPTGKAPVKVSGPYEISATDADGISVLVNPGSEYLFEASGTFIPTSAPGYIADAGYTTINGVLSNQYGIHGTGSDYGAHALLGNFGSGVGLIDWGTYNPEHVYNKYFVPDVGSLQFLINDRYDSWFNTSWNNQTGMNDNSGSLALNVYECREIGSIAGKKYIDYNDDGQYNNTDGDTLYEGWIIKLYKHDGTNYVYLTETTTDSNGEYLFDNLEAGMYKIVEDINSSYVVTDPNGFGLYNGVLLQPGEDLTGFDFGNFEKGDLYVDKYEDLDGVLGRNADFEPFISDPTFTFRVYEATAGGWLLKAQEDTDSIEGRATFTDVFDSVGSYFVCEVKKDGWEDMRSLHNPDNNLSGATDEYPTCEGITVSMSGYGVYAEFGNIRYGSISGMKFEDVDGNGVKDVGDNGLEDWMIVLRQGETIIETTTTDVNGLYSFASVLSGEYEVCEVEQTGWTRTQPSDAQCWSVTVNPGQYLEGVDFGNFENGQITACKYDDYNGDGIKDENEPGIIGVAMTLEKKVCIYPDNGLDGITRFLISDGICQEGWEEVLTQDTQEEGCYTFDNLGPGEYRVKEDLIDDDLAGYFPTDSWTTDGDYRVSDEKIMTSNDSFAVDYFNDINPIELSLDKTSDKIDLTATQNESVNFTLTVTNNADSTAYGVSVRDVLPTGFDYTEGTTGGTGWTIAEPVQSGQQLTWNVGNIPAGESRVIIYEVVISSGQGNGCYPDVAVASGTNRSSDPDMTTTYSNFAFVYTCVGVGTSYSVIVGGSVLGAATTAGEVLGAATGSPTMLLITAILMILAGLTILLLKKGKKLHV